MRFGDKSNFNHTEIIRRVLGIALLEKNEELKDYEKNGDNYGEIDWDIRRIKAALESLDQRVNPGIMQQSGGKFLGLTRDWIQWECRNGSAVTWGSDQVLQKDITVADIERLSFVIASAAVNQDRGY
jgi:hypothetical protein